MQVLVVDDDMVHRKMAVDCLVHDGIQADAVRSAEEAFALINNGTQYDALISDYRMSGMSGIDLVRKLGRPPNAPPTILVTGMGDEQIAAEAIKAGAADYLAKDLPRLGYLVVLSTKVREAVRHNKVLLENHRLQQRVRELSGCDSIVAGSSEMKLILELVREVAIVDSTVLITGESGTGKELIARSIHESSPRRNGPFVDASCGAFSESLLESELFGHEAGAFTGARDRRIGRFEKAHGGTIFLDEISEISPKAQVDLLRVLQEHKFERVGGHDTVEVNVRVLAATNKDLENCITEHRFREDLYYRLNVIPVVIPPLRDRSDDIAPLAYHFLKRFSDRFGKQVEAFSPAALHALQNYGWPGNVRQLENAIERAVVLARLKTIDLRDLTDSIVHRDRGTMTATENLAALEKSTIVRVLGETSWNLNQAAKRLGISRTTLYSKIRKHNLRNT